eukprot:6904063-Prymnesium_polylepis.1
MNEGLMRSTVSLLISSSSRSVSPIMRANSTTPSAARRSRRLWLRRVTYPPVYPGSSRTPIHIRINPDRRELGLNR